MKTNHAGKKVMHGWKTVWRALCDAVVLSGAMQSGSLPPESVLREIAARVKVREAATRLPEVGVAPEQAPVTLVGCCHGCGA